MAIFCASSARFSCLHLVEACTQMFCQNMKMHSSAGRLRTSNDMDLYLVSFSHFTPPRSTKGFFIVPLFTIPEECNLAWIQTGWFVAHSYPVIDGWIVFAQSFSCWENRIWENRIERWKCKSHSVTFELRPNLFFSFQACCTLAELQFIERLQC